LLGAAIVCGFTYFNDAVIRQTFFVSHHMPFSVYGSLILFVLVGKPLLGRISKRLVLSGKELAVILTLTLFACCIPSSGLMRFLAEIGIPQPPALRAAAELALNLRIRRCLEGDKPDLEKARRLTEEMLRTGLRLDSESIGFALARIMERWGEALEKDPDRFKTLSLLDSALVLARDTNLKLNLWKVQNAYYSTMHRSLPAMKGQAEKGSSDAQLWMQRFESLGTKLGVLVSP